MKEAANGGGAPGRVTPSGTGLDGVMSGVARGERDPYLTLSASIGQFHDGDGQDAARH